MPPADLFVVPWKMKYPTTQEGPLWWESQEYMPADADTVGIIPAVSAADKKVSC